MPQIYERVLALASFMVATGEPTMYCEDWLNKTDSIEAGELTSQKISEMLLAITNANRCAFYEKWGETRSEQEYFALDITSISSYSEMIGDVNWGYNRDKEKLPQINVCMLVGEKSRLPIFQTDIDSLKNTIVINGDVLRGVTKSRAWSASQKLFTHIFCNTVLAHKKQNELYGHVSMLQELAKADPRNASLARDFEKYLTVRSSSKNEGGVTVSIRQDVIDKELSLAGWMVAVSNFVTNSKEALAIYRAKDVVEKGFLRLKNCLDLAHLRVHSDSVMQNKVFIGFIALILTAHIHKVMSEKGLYKTMTMTKLLKTLETLRVQYISGKRILYPPSALQKTIFSAFGFDLPM